MSVVKVYKPEFGAFHETPIVTWREPRGAIRTEVNMYAQYMTWLEQWTNAFGRDKHAPATAFWESGGPAICRALRYCGAVALVFDYVADRKVAYRWFARSYDEERPLAHKTDYYSICSVIGEVNSKTSEGRVVVTMPTDEDFTFYFHAAQMKNWLKPAKQEPAS